MSRKTQEEIILEEMFEWLEIQRRKTTSRTEDIMIDAIETFLGYPKSNEVICCDKDTKEQDLYVR